MIPLEGSFLNWQYALLLLFGVYGFIALFSQVYHLLMGKGNKNFGKASALIIVENGEQVIEGVIRKLVSLQENFYPHWEILVIDNFSRDATVQIISGLQRECPQIRVIRPRSFGSGSLLEWGIGQCEGDLVILYDLINRGVTV